ncbi:B3/B4 domain-containing protein [Pollutimonas bauzanensis]|uniref:B3/B4 domain-containing protein (DNA/RNA-binding domain of Phe-tRNA-synthetase) n=1 Tax=Pollutimonas bauzanensis TaxID=658167 RepID=A0A1M5MTI5_9BURK|nr:phenylalanine--tRNA ligase beta subunit-related protein [Pollutimonas bauzanensis]SHG80556.1 B3/B4 domain-containing protein (DNA/RNA-binding domain of Phe-tRNA-synthetase) [Pollutimonas bauzanensis]
MYFYHSDEVWDRFPKLVALVLVVHQVRAAVLKAGALEETLARVGARLETTLESDIPAIQAWRQAYADMGLKPTQYRCAAEALLRRFRKAKHQQDFHPLVDTLNAESMHAALPIAAFDCACITGGVVVRHANGLETHRTFQGETEQPTTGEIIFADEANQAHSRRWVFRQGAESAVSSTSNTVLIVAEALHGQAREDLHTLHERIAYRASELGVLIAEADVLTNSNRRFEFIFGL